MKSHIKILDYDSHEKELDFEGEVVVREELIRERPTSAPSSLEINNNLFSSFEDSVAPTFLSNLDFYSEDPMVLKPRANYPSQPISSLHSGLNNNSFFGSTSERKNSMDLFLSQSPGRALSNNNYNIFMRKRYDVPSHDDINSSTSSITDGLNRMSIRNILNASPDTVVSSEQSSFIHDGSERNGMMGNSRSANTSPIRSTSVSTIRNSSSPMSDSGINPSMFYNNRNNDLVGSVSNGRISNDAYESGFLEAQAQYSIQNVNHGEDFRGMNMNQARANFHNGYGPPPSHGPSSHGPPSHVPAYGPSPVEPSHYYNSSNSGGGNGGHYLPLQQALHHQGPLGMSSNNGSNASWRNPPIYSNNPNMQHLNGSNNMGLINSGGYFITREEMIHVKENMNQRSLGLAINAVPTGVCKYFAHGRCSKGDTCKYVHGSNGKIPAFIDNSIMLANERNIANSMIHESRLSMIPNVKINSSGSSSPPNMDKKLKRALSKEDRKSSAALTTEAASGSLADYQGRILAMSKDQNGCRTLQQQLDLAGTKGLDIIYNEIKNNMIEIMMDSFGNYLFQKIMDLSTDGQRIDIVKQVSGQLVSAAVNLHGTRSVQKIVQVCRRADQVVIVVDALKNHVVQLSMDTNGNHVIQRCLQHMSSNEKQFVFDAILINCLTVATHRHGCCVVQRCLDAADNVQRRSLVLQIFKYWHQLMQDAYGNYVVQFVVDKGNKEDSAELMRQLQGHIVELSSQKYSSNVIEKCLKCASDKQRQDLLLEIASSNNLPRLLNHQYGNYVVQSALNVATSPEKIMLVDAILPYLSTILNSSAGRRIVSLIQKEYPGKLGMEIFNSANLLT